MVQVCRNGCRIWMQSLIPSYILAWTSSWGDWCGNDFLFVFMESSRIHRWSNRIPVKHTQNIPPQWIQSRPRTKVVKRSHSESGWIWKVTFSSNFTRRWDHNSASGAGSKAFRELSQSLENFNNAPYDVWLGRPKTEVFDNDVPKQLATSIPCTAETENTSYTNHSWRRDAWKETNFSLKVKPLWDFFTHSILYNKKYCLSCLWSKLLKRKHSYIYGSRGSW